VDNTNQFVSRAGLKLDHAISTFNIDANNKVCADFGCSTGGFTDCLLQHGATKVYAVDTAYGELAWKLRNDSRVVVTERKNALHVELPEKVDICVIDVAWTKLEKIIPNALANLKPEGRIVALLKPQYEVDKKYLKNGAVEAEYLEIFIPEFIENLNKLLANHSRKIAEYTKSPIVGDKAKNSEFLLLIV